MVEEAVSGCDAGVCKSRGSVAALCFGRVPGLGVLCCAHTVEAGLSLGISEEPKAA